MNLNSIQDKILLKNCVIIKLKQLDVTLANQRKNQAPLEEIQNNQECIRYYKLLHNLLESNDTESLSSILKASMTDKRFKDFSKSIFFKPSNEIAQEYIHLTKSLLLENGVYSDEKFEEFKEAFYKENENLNPDYSKTAEYEEEPEKDNSSKYLTENMKTSLNRLNRLTRQNPKIMTASGFKNFAAQFRDITMELGKNKFQQYFDEQGQTITSMIISYEQTHSAKPVYKTDFILSDNHSQENHLSIQEPASTSGFTSTYFQNLCYSYLEAAKYADIDESLLDIAIVSTKMDDFRECYKKLDEMMTKCKITIAGNSIFYSSESEIEPTELDLEACNSQPDSPTGNEIEI